MLKQFYLLTYCFTWFILSVLPVSFKTYIQKSRDVWQRFTVTVWKCGFMIVNIERWRDMIVNGKIKKYQNGTQTEMHFWVDEISRRRNMRFMRCIIFQITCHHNRNEKTSFLNKHISGHKVTKIFTLPDYFHSLKLKSSFEWEI